MTILLIGHRGVGKTSFLRSLKTNTFDLDEEIEKRAQQTISEIWQNGEAHFRAAERETLRQLLELPVDPKVIALGAGFEGPFPSNVHVVWIRRETDRDGRVFLNRPRLNPSVSLLDEYLERFEVRERRFEQWADEQLIVPEGYDTGLESFVLNPSHLQAPFDFTLKPEHFKNLPTFLEKRSLWNVRRFELRDDLLSNEQMELAKKHLPSGQLMISARQTPTHQKVDDWALELGNPPAGASIVSLHERSSEFTDALNRINSYSGHILKLAVEVHSFTELQMGHQWWLQDPLKRAFLPRSPNGRWRWYRSLFGPKMPIHFFREDEGSALDQPLLWQIQMQSAFRQHFAAVLGSPIHHSRSPLEHLDFFKQQNMPFVAIDIQATEFTEAIAVLKYLGLKYAAVTSPLKTAAFEICNDLSPEAQDLRSVNTLVFQEQTTLGYNTDVLALKDMQADYPNAAEVWLWGGGGVRPAVRAAWPNAKEISARVGTAEAGAPDLLIWATGRSNTFQWPLASVRPKQVLDLNYSESSPGLEWAAANNLPYHSGLRMFKLQAEYQRQIWRRSF